MVLPDRRVEVALDVTTNGISSVRRAIRQLKNTEDQLDELSDAATNVGNNLSAVEKHVEQTGKSFNRNSRGVSAYRQRLSEATAITQSLSDESESLVGVLDELREDGIDTSNANLSKYVRNLTRARASNAAYGDSIKKLKYAFRELPQEDLDIFLESLERGAPRKSGDFGAPFGDNSNVAGQIGSDMERATKAMDEFDRKTARAGSRFAELSSILKRGSGNGVTMRTDFFKAIFDDDRFVQNPFDDTESFFASPLDTDAPQVARQRAGELLDSKGREDSVAEMNRARMSLESAFVNTSRVEAMQTDDSETDPLDFFNVGKAFKRAQLRVKTGGADTFEQALIDNLEDKSRIPTERAVARGMTVMDRIQSSEDIPPRIKDAFKTGEISVSGMGKFDEDNATLDAMLSDAEKFSVGSRKTIQNAVSDAFTNLDDDTPADETEVERGLPSGGQRQFNAVRAFRRAQQKLADGTAESFDDAADMVAETLDVPSQTAAQNLKKTMQDIQAANFIPDAIQSGIASGDIPVEGDFENIDTDTDRLNNLLNVEIDNDERLTDFDGRPMDATRSEVLDFVEDLTEFIRDTQDGIEGIDADDDIANKNSILGILDGLRDDESLLSLRRHLDGRGHANVISTIKENPEVLNLLGPQGMRDMLPRTDNTSRLEVLKEELPFIGGFKRQLLLKTMQELEDDQVPLTPETLESRLFKLGINEESRQARQAVADLITRSQTGSLSLPDSSLSENAFESQFIAEADRNLTMLSDAERRDVVQAVSKAVDNNIKSLRQLTASERGPLASIIGETIELDDRSPTAVVRALENAANNTRIGAMEQGAPGLTQLLDESNIKQNDRVHIPTDGNDVMGAMSRARAVAQGRPIQTTLFSRLSAFISDSASDRFGFDMGSQQRVNKTIRRTTKGLTRLVPVLGVTSANIGAFNVQLKSIGQILGGLIGTVGAAAGALLGFASALVTAGVGLASFVAVGGLGFLETMEESMADVSSRGEALEKLTEDLAEKAIDALQPLREARLGGTGPTAQGFFVDSIQAGLALLEDFAEVMADVVETPAVKRFVDRISDSLFSGGDLTPALQDMMRLLLPGITNVLVGFIDSLPALINGLTRLADILGDSLGRALAKFIDQLPLLIAFGEAFLRMVGGLALAILTIFEVLTDIIADTIGRLGVAIGVIDNKRQAVYLLAAAVGVLSGTVYTLTTALGILNAVLASTTFTVMARGLMLVATALGSVLGISSGVVLASTGVIVGFGGIAAAVALVAVLLAEVISLLVTGDSILADYIPHLDTFYAYVQKLAVGFNRILRPAQILERTVAGIANTVDRATAGIRNLPGFEAASNFDNSGIVQRQGPQGATAEQVAGNSRGMVINVANSVVNPEMFVRTIKQEANAQSRRNQMMQSKFMTR
jgi:hypothetical protein